jgi:hypothetical protein
LLRLDEKPKKATAGLLIAGGCFFKTGSEQHFIEQGFQ